MASTERIAEHLIASRKLRCVCVPILSHPEWYHDAELVKDRVVRSVGVPAGMGCVPDVTFLSCSCHRRDYSLPIQWSASSFGVASGATLVITLHVGGEFRSCRLEGSFSPYYALGAYKEETVHLPDDFSGRDVRELLVRLLSHERTLWFFVWRHVANMVRDYVPSIAVATGQEQVPTERYMEMIEYGFDARHAALTHAAEMLSDMVRMCSGKLPHRSDEFDHKALQAASAIIAANALDIVQSVQRQEDAEEVVKQILLARPEEVSDEQDL